MPESTQTHSVQQFLKQVEWLHEPEYGDFKRKVGLYLSRLEQALGAKALTPSKRAVFAEIRDFVIYQPSGDVETTRAKVISLVKKL